MKRSIIIERSGRVRNENERLNRIWIGHPMRKPNESWDHGVGVFRYEEKKTQTETVMGG